MNDYYLCYPDRFIAWSPFDPPTNEWTRSAYFGGIFEVLEKHLETDDLTIYLTSDFRKLPSYGDDVIAVLQEDEPARVPRYASRVLATFACYGTSQPLRPNPLTHPSCANLLAAVRYTRNFLLRLPGKLRYGWRGFMDQSVPPIYDIPLGYANQVSLPLKRMEERSRDVFFAGSITHHEDPDGLRKWIGTPKYYARKQMLESLQSLDRRYPNVEVDVKSEPTFGSSITSSARDYSKRMMNAKICPAPRGTSLESFRFFEALRFGCIPLIRALPSRWYYDDAPAIRVDDWEELEDVIPHLLDCPARLQKKHDAALDWWESKCSEEAIGRFMAERVNELLDT